MTFEVKSKLSTNDRNVVTLTAENQQLHNAYPIKQDPPPTGNTSWTRLESEADFSEAFTQTGGAHAIAAIKEKEK